MSTQADEVIIIHDVRQLPYVHIPYHSIEHARSKHPTGTLYHFKSLVKQGWQIVAWPVVMLKPEESEDGG